LIETNLNVVTNIGANFRKNPAIPRIRRSGKQIRIDMPGGARIRFLRRTDVESIRYDTTGVEISYLDGTLSRIDIQDEVAVKKVFDQVTHMIATTPLRTWALRGAVAIVLYYFLQGILIGILSGPRQPVPAMPPLSEYQQPQVPPMSGAEAAMLAELTKNNQSVAANFGGGMPDSFQKQADGSLRFVPKVKIPEIKPTELNCDKG
jgi:hypothetical protein